MLQDDLERELNNWALWLAAGGWGYTRGSLGLVTNYSPVPTRYREATIPVLAGAASDVDGIVTRLTAELRAVLYAKYLRADPAGRRLPPSLTVVQMARAIGVSCRTFERRLADARQRVGDELTAMRQRSCAIGANNPMAT